MMSGLLLDEITDTHAVTVMECPSLKEYVAEAFIKDKGFLWYAVIRYGFEPNLARIFRDTYAMKLQSPRPYKAGQICDGSITAPVFHLYNQVCTILNLDPVALYAEAYEDNIFTKDQLDETLRFAEWQGVEAFSCLDAKIIENVMESLHEVNMHQLAAVLEDKIGM